MIPLILRFFSGLRRDLRSIELVWLFVALTLSITALSSVSFLADRMQRAFAFDARQLLAADLLLVSDQPLPANFLDEARDRGLRLAQTVVFPSMATVGANSKLASLKAVSPQYPLRGELRVQSYGFRKPINEKIKEGSVWVEPAMLASLRAEVGDSIQLGQKIFVIDGILERELDRGAGFMNFAPRVMMSMADLSSTGLIGLGSRVTYRLLLAGADDQIAAYDVWSTKYIEAEGLKGIRIETLENAQPMMRKTLERADRFLSLIALLTAMVSAVAIALSAHRYTRKQADACAVLKCIGASSKAILVHQSSTLLVIGLIAGLLGSLLGYLGQYILTILLGNLVMSDLPQVSLWPVLWSTLVAWCLLLGFAGPAIFRLVCVSPVRLIRKEFSGMDIASVWTIIIGLVAAVILIMAAARDWKLALWTTVSFASAVVIFAALSWGLLRLISAIPNQRFALGFVILSQGRKAGLAIVQITALGIALMALLLVLLLRADFLSAWQGNIPSDAPNRFMINVQEEQKPGLIQALQNAGVTTPQFYPMVRGRLVEVNGKDISPNNYAEENAKRLIDREFNLSYTDQLPAGNQIQVGKWIEGDAPQISMEVGIAKTLKLKTGDELTFEVAGEKITAPITSLRKLDWGSMRVNFFVIMPPGQLQSLPQSWITSYYQAPNQDSLDFQLSQSYPNLTIVDVSASLQQIQEVLNKLSSVLGLLLAFTIVAAVLVLMSAIAATQDDRYKNAALLKALGASRSTLAYIANIELLLIGITAGLLAGLASGLAAWALGRFVMEIQFHSFGQALLMGIAFGVIACLVSGYRFQRRIQNATAIECLREV